MAPFLQILARTTQLSSGFISKHSVASKDQSTPPSPASAPAAGNRLAHDPVDVGFGQGPSAYVFYGGTGAIAEGWPDEDQWRSFDDLWSANLPIIRSSCTSAGLAQTDNTPTDTDALHNAITTAATLSNVDGRFILAVIIQESKGCVRVRTTSSPGAAVRNPGLMQSHNGRGSCADASECPPATIDQMVQDGAGGTSSGDGLKQCLASADGTPAEKTYRAARMYNSGSIAPSGLLGEGVATHCYASDIANRLMGWTDAPSKCFLDDR